MTEKIIVKIRKVENGFVAEFCSRLDDFGMGDVYVARATGELQDCVREQFAKRLDEVVGRIINSKKGSAP